MLHYFILFLHSRMSAIIIIFILFSLNPARSSRLPLPHSVSSHLKSKRGTKRTSEGLRVRILEGYFTQIISQKWFLSRSNIEGHSRSNPDIFHISTNQTWNHGIRMLDSNLLLTKFIKNHNFSHEVKVYLQTTLKRHSL